LAKNWQYIALPFFSHILEQRVYCVHDTITATLLPSYYESIQFVIFDLLWITSVVILDMCRWWKA